LPEGFSNAYAKEEMPRAVSSQPIAKTEQDRAKEGAG
jgi:hypothetical protein